MERSINELKFQMNMYPFTGVIEQNLHDILEKIFLIYVYYETISPITFVLDIKSTLIKCIYLQL